MRQAVRRGPQSSSDLNKDANMELEIIYVLIMELQILINSQKIFKSTDNRLDQEEGNTLLNLKAEI